MNQFQVIETNTSEDCINLSLGISDERHIELCDHIVEQFDLIKSKNIVEIIAKSSTICKNANEIAYVTFKIVKSIEMATNNPVMGLLQMLGGLR